ncbi:MAG: glycosyl hydrolase family 95 catalytic domain-containing protein [Acidobacteriaceae bacterium]
MVEAAADRWFDALPMGNGRLGAMVYGGGCIGFRQSWAICLWARPGHCDKSAEFFRTLVTESTNGTLPDICVGRSRIFQIEGNFGASTVREEMRLQSHADSIDPLPALPAVWPSGPTSTEWLHYSATFAELLESEFFICKGEVRRMSRDEAPIWMV